MKKDIKNIEPGVGLGSIKFGMLSSDVIEILGNPNEIEVFLYSTDGKDVHENWHYHDYELQISFSSEDHWKLDIIAINSSYYRLLDLIQIGQSRISVEKKLNNLEFNNLIYEDLSNLNSPDHKLISIDELSLNLWFDDSELSEIQWSPKFKDEETIIWPYQSKKQASETTLKKYSYNELLTKMEKYLINWLNKIFLKTESSDHTELLKKFPDATERDNLILEKSSVTYYLNIDNKINGSIETKADLSHSSEGLIGSMSVIWDNELNVLDDFLVIY